VDTETGEYGERRLQHRWFERLLGELQVELWIGTPPRSRGSANASRRRIARMHNTFGGGTAQEVWQNY